MKLLETIYCEQFKRDCGSYKHDFCLEKKDFDVLLDFWHYDWRNNEIKSLRIFTVCSKILKRSKDEKSDYFKWCWIIS